MTPMMVVAIVAFVLASAGIPLLLVGMDLIRKWGRKKADEKK